MNPRGRMTQAGAALPRAVRKAADRAALALAARDYFEDRAAIREYLGGQSRAAAEADARRETFRRFGTGGAL